MTHQADILDDDKIDIDQTQLVCDFNKYGRCPCTAPDDSVYECLCNANAASSACKNCKAAMIRIETNSGEIVSPDRLATP